MHRFFRYKQFKLLYWQRLAEQITLKISASLVDQELVLCCRFHTFRHHIQAQLGGHGNDRLNKVGITVIGGNVSDEGLIDLDFIQRQAFKIRER